MSKLDDLAKQFMTSKDNNDFKDFMEELEKSLVFVPAKPSDEMAEKIKAAAAEGKGVVAPQNEQPGILLLNKGDGGKIFPIFTSREQIPKEQLPPALLNMPFRAVIGIMKKNMSEVKEIVVNPFTNGIVLNENLIDLADRRFKQQSMMSKKAEDGEADIVQLSPEQFHNIACSRVARDILPTKVYGDFDALMSDLAIKKDQAILDMLKSVYPADFECPFTDEEVEVMRLQLDEELFLTRIDLPEKYVYLGNPVRAYITLNRGDVDYFVVEKSSDKRQGFIARVDKNKQYTQVAPAPLSSGEIEMIISLINPS